MTEGGWLTSSDPRKMLEGIKGWVGLTARRKRLFAVACVRRIWRLIEDERIREVLEAAEAHADGHMTAGKLEFIGKYANAAWREAHARLEEAHPDVARYATNDPSPEAAWACAIRAGLAAAAFDPDHTLSAHYGAIAASAGFYWGHHPCPEEKAAQAHLLRDIVGNPYRPVAFQEGWRAAGAVTLATACYETRDFAALPILGDALEEAGCEDEAVLAHCRAPLPHARGCWVVDAVLGKG